MCKLGSLVVRVSLSQIEKARLEAAPCLFAFGLDALLQPIARFMFALLGAKGLSVTSSACAFQILGITPEADCSGSGCVISIWLHGLSQWSASIGQVAAKRNQQNRGYQESQVGWDRSGLAAQEPKCYGTSDQVGSLKGTAFRPSVNASISNSALAAEGLRRDLTIVALHDLRCQQIGHRLSHADQPRTLAIHQHLSRAWPGVVVRGQRHAVRARV